MEIFDTHCHIDLPAFDADREAVISHARELGVTHMVVPAIVARGWKRLVSICNEHPGLLPALGLHPMFTSEHIDADITALAETVEHTRPVAIGEIGLDYFIDGADRKRQQTLLEAQLDLARQFDLPVILHVRKAHDNMLATLRRLRVCGGTAHAFSGSLQQAQQYIDLGFRLGFGGMITHERATRLRRLACELPAEALVLETDAPDMPGAAHRGQRNSPEYLPEYLHVLAQLRNEDPETLARQTSANAREVFGLGSL